MPCHVLQGSPVQAMVTNSITRISNDSATGLQELEDVLQQWRPNFGFVQTSAAFVKAAKLEGLRLASARLLLDKLAGVWDTVLPYAETRQLSNVLWACGKLQYTNPQLWSSTLAAVQQRLTAGQQDFIGVNIANMLHGLANVAAQGRVPGVAPADVEAAVRQLCECMRVMVTHPLLEGASSQNALWACAKLRINPGDAALNSMLQALARPALREAMESQHISNALWAVSELQHECGWQPVQPRV
eukprot:GHRQ01025427.1.p2 GENE.GHRQ01025427.1~~GHRQ01025427.1.p2  ORF type:complete len:244 (+),score=91.77 GHRQ01025427.1:19-750(+)